MRIFIMMIVAAAAHAATPRNLGFTTSAQSLATNACSTVVEVQTQDYAFNPVNLTSSTTFTPSGSFTFYSDSGCTSSISTVTISAGSSIADFYFKSGTSGALTLQVSGGGLNVAKQTETLSATATTCGNTTTCEPQPTTSPVPSPQPCTDCGFPSSNVWMTEQEEVDWINSLGFSVTLTQLRASYTSFTPTTVDPNTSVSTLNSDDLRNYYRLYKRTSYSGFLTQAQSWRDYYVNSYSQYTLGGSNRIDTEHIWMIGIIDWYLDHTSESDTLAAISSVIDFILANVGGDLVETNIHARALESLVYYIAKMPSNAYRMAEARTLVNALLDSLDRAPFVNGFIAMPKIYDGSCHTMPTVAQGVDLTVAFPDNNLQGLVCGPTQYKYGGFAKPQEPGVQGNVDPILMHALRMAGRVLQRPHWTERAATIAGAWKQRFIGYEFWDTSHTSPMVVAYIAATKAMNPQMYLFRGNSTPLYITQHAAFCTDTALRKRLQQQAMLRAYGQFNAISESEIIGQQPAYYPWKQWEQGYFVTQK